MSDQILKSFTARVYGIVQGVGFRYSTYREANKLQLKGYVRNMSDSSVEVVAEGEAEKLKIFLKWLNKGPPGAIVRNITCNYSQYHGIYENFTISY